MKISLDTHFATETMRDYRRKMGERQFAKAVGFAINRVAATSKTKAGRLIRDTYKIGKKDLDRNMGVTKASFGRSKATIFAFGVPLDLRMFKPIQRKKGVSVNIMGKRRTIPGSFMARMKSGYYGVFARGSYGQNGFEFREKRARKKGNDLGITKMVTVSQATMFSNDKVMKSTIDTIHDQFPKRLEHEVGRLMGGIR